MLLRPDYMTWDSSWIESCAVFKLYLIFRLYNLALSLEFTASYSIGGVVWLIEYEICFVSPIECYLAVAGIIGWCVCMKRWANCCCWWWIHQWRTPWHCQRTRHRVLRDGRTLGINANYIWLRRLSATLYICINRTSPLITPIRWHYQARISCNNTCHNPYSIGLCDANWCKWCIGNDHHQHHPHY